MKSGILRTGENSTGRNNMERIVEEYRQSYEKFEKKFEEIKQAYENTKDEKRARADLQKLASEHRTHYGACFMFLEYGKEIFDKEKIEYGFKILQIGMNTFKDPPKDTGIYLRFVQYNMEHNQEDKAEEYLLKICNGVSNYDESIEWSGMSEIWKKYKYLVDGKVPLPLSQRQPVAKAPDECTMQIKDVLQLSKEELLSGLSEHLGEIEKKFPKGKVPKSYDRLEKILDKMIENDEDFDEEETKYYYDADVEKELVECLYRYVLENKKRFR